MGFLTYWKAECIPEMFALLFFFFFVCKEEKLKSWDAGTNWEDAANKLVCWSRGLTEEMCLYITALCLDKAIFMHCEGQTAEVQEFMAWW